MLTETADGIVRGITANSFSSVSLHPPIILWSIDLQSDRRDFFVESETFSVNILREDQQDYARQFAKDMTATLPEDQQARDWRKTPVFTGGLASMVCETLWRQKAGDHIVIFGGVKSFRSETGSALGFFKGGYVPLTSGSE